MLLIFLMSDQWTVNSEHTKEMFLKHVEKIYDENKHVTFSYKLGKQRSAKQNSAMHVYLKMLSEALNNAGLDMRRVLKPSVDIPWTQQSAKDYLWRPIQKVMTGHKSSSKPKRGEYIEIYETLNRHTAEKFEISIPWPVKSD